MCGFCPAGMSQYSVYKRTLQAYALEDYTLTLIHSLRSFEFNFKIVNVLIIPQDTREMVTIVPT